MKLLDLIVIGLCLLNFIMLYNVTIFSKKSVRLFEEIKKDLVNSIKNEVHSEFSEIEKINKDLFDKTRLDSMTGAVNKKGIIEVINSMIDANRPFSLLMFDIDNFKKINDSKGHVIGDKCIMDLSRVIKNAIRDTDIFGRYGGDEFIIVFPKASDNVILSVAEKIQYALQKNNENSEVLFTISIGAVTYIGGETTVEEVIAIADTGLYQAKAEGKNVARFGGVIGNYFSEKECYNEIF